jgi:hypothetical protein
MCETQTLLQTLLKYHSSSQVIHELLERGWLIRPVAPSGGGCYGGYALCPKCLTIISWWVCPPPEYPDSDITVCVGWVNSTLKQKFEEDLTKTVYMLKKVNEEGIWVPVNIPI